jgi:hypothetical protein
MIRQYYVVYILHTPVIFVAMVITHWNELHGRRYRGSTSRTQSPIRISSIEENNTKCRLQEALLSKWWQLTIEGQLLADPPTGRISTTCNQRILRCQHSVLPWLTQHHYDFITQGDVHGARCRVDHVSTLTVGGWQKLEYDEGQTVWREPSRICQT